MYCIRICTVHYMYHIYSIFIFTMADKAQTAKQNTVASLTCGRSEGRRGFVQGCDSAGDRRRIAGSAQRHPHTALNNQQMTLSTCAEIKH